MNETERSVLITGANGFVGSRLCRKFLDEGFTVIAGVRKSADLSLLEGLDIHYRYGDVTRPDTLPEMVRDVDYIIHNAGVVKAKKKQLFFDVNELGTKSLFEAIVEYNPYIKKVIYISSLAAAGPSLKGNPVTETDIPHPVTTYGASKLAGEKQVMTFSDKLNIVILRPSGIYGPGEKEILSVFETLKKGIKPYIGNMQRKLQLVHVDDLCLGVYKTIIGETTSGSLYFIAENRAYTMEELMSHFEAAVGKKCFPLVLPASIFKAIAYVSKTLFKLVNATPMLTPEKTRELLASWEISTEKAKQEIGFESTIPLAQGAKETYAWYKKEGWL